MRLAITILAFVAPCVLLVPVAMMMTTTRLTVAAEKPAGVLRHVVLYKFKDDLSAAQVQEVVDAFCKLATQVDSIIGFEHGTNVRPEGKSDGLTHAFAVTFRDESGRDLYLKHPAHAEYVNVVKNRREKVVVFDYFAEK
jgi:hypothetical protein